MYTRITKIDRQGRISIPHDMLNKLGLLPEKDVIIEFFKSGIVIKPKSIETPITKKIAAMNLPVSDWEQIEDEIEKGRVE